MARNHFFSPFDHQTNGSAFHWGRLARVGRLALGGSIVGAFLGVYVGAGLGLIYAAWAGDISTALDGALLGGAALALLGGGFGLALGLTESEDEHNAGLEDLTPALPAWPDRQNGIPREAPPAGRLGSTDSPKMENAHGR